MTVSPIETIDLRIDLERGDTVSGRLVRPQPARCLLMLAHGAGAGMHHHFMESAARRLAGVGIATMRYQFPFAEAGRRRPDARPLLVETVLAAEARARSLADGLPLLAGGKSMGGRMTSHAASEGLLAAVRGLCFLGFPLHPAGTPGTSRANHLRDVPQPMHFVQGTRDRLASLDLLEPICRDLGSRATLHIIDGADHGFHVLKRSGRTDDDVLDEIARTVGAWAGLLGLGSPGRQ